MSAHNASVRRILLTGQCTLHWGRMEFGNIGNYYILEPLMRELHRVFPGAEIRTTFQLSEDFCQRERVTVLPADLYYGWRDDDLENASREMGAARHFATTGELHLHTPYLDEVRGADLIVDFSGDLWGDNASLLGPHRFQTGLLKDRTAQLLGKPVVMLAGSPGPFSTAVDPGFVREVFANFTWVSNREPMSRALLAANGFRVDHVADCACPSFLFEPADATEASAALARERVARRGRPVVGMIVCGWNFAQGPFDRWPREDGAFHPFIAAAEHAAGILGADVWLISHANGFSPPPAPFVLQRGRDFAIVEHLHRLLLATAVAPFVSLLRGPFSPRDTKAIIGQCDLLVAGRVHGAVAGLSQQVPTVIVDYGHEPRAHKLRGIARSAGVSDCVAAPDAHDLVVRLDWCAGHRSELKARLARTIPGVQAQARANFDPLPGIVERFTARRTS